MNFKQKSSPPKFHLSTTQNKNSPLLKLRRGEARLHPSATDFGEAKAGATRLELVTLGSTSQCSSQLSYARKYYVPGAGIEPTLIAYETTLETSLLPGKNLLRRLELHQGLEVMGLARYYSSTPRCYFTLPRPFCKV